MASPQLENGYTSIANEILEHLSLPGINGSEYRIAIFVLRKTYGFHKKTDRLSLTQFQKGTLMSRKHVSNTLKSLVYKRVLAKEKNTYKFNKNWEEWLVYKRTPSVQKDTTASVQKDPKSSVQMTTYKRKKETITKETSDVPSPYVFSLEDAIKKMEENPRRDINIIALFLETRKPDIRSPDQLSIAIKRHLRPAKSLEPFTDNQIIDAFDRAKKITPEWTLETAIKVLTK